MTADGLDLFAIFDKSHMIFLSSKLRKHEYIKLQIILIAYSYFLNFNYGRSETNSYIYNYTIPFV